MADTRYEAADDRLLHAGQHSRRLVLLRGLLAQMDRHSVPHPKRERLDDYWRLLERAESRAPVAAREALAYPSIGNWLVQALSVPVRDISARGEFLDGFGAIAAAVALHAGAGFRMTLPTQGGRLTLPGIGVYEARTESVRLVAGPRSLRLTSGGRGGVVLRTVPDAPCRRAQGPAAGWRGLRTLPGGSVLLDDLDPHRAGPPLTARSAQSESGSGLGSRRLRAWRSRWQAALALLGSADPGRRTEVASLVRSVVPLERESGAVVSATLRAAPWSVLTGLPESAHDMATVLVHEVQHSKLAVLSDLVPLHPAEGPAVHQVSWRPDPRPVGAVLQGTYAHLALADLWYRMAQRTGASPAARDVARRRCAHYREQTDEALVLLLRSGELTFAGEVFTRAMRRHHTSLAPPRGSGGASERVPTRRRAQVIIS
ncbi:aKG-HExxH-type peptide beta-hydroxylase [Streptomyces gossypii]|uniref:aKG-HExxH-type peptide beta-hydroxylase n=1 Tax=Streptomyces gossypii TaxID=2883101 RepID=UPI0021A52A64|nr:HEXXH motif-containing putative peptide modification protein [Streptomyces gossypii]